MVNHGNSTTGICMCRAVSDALRSTGGMQEEAEEPVLLRTQVPGGSAETPAWPFWYCENDQ